MRALVRAIRDNGYSHSFAREALEGELCDVAGAEYHRPPSSETTEDFFRELNGGRADRSGASSDAGEYHCSEGYALPWNNPFERRCDRRAGNRGRAPGVGRERDRRRVVDDRVDARVGEVELFDRGTELHFADAYDKWVKEKGNVFRLRDGIDGHHGTVKLRWEMLPQPAAR